MAKPPAPKRNAGDDDNPIPEEINDMIRRALKSPPKPREGGKRKGDPKKE